MTFSQSDPSNRYIYIHKMCVLCTSLKMPRLCKKVSTVFGRSLCSECGPVAVGGGGGGDSEEVGVCEGVRV